jgi:hypothetical protein
MLELWEMPEEELPVFRMLERLAEICPECRAAIEEGLVDLGIGWEELRRRLAPREP